MMSSLLVCFLFVCLFLSCNNLSYVEYNLNNLLLKYVCMDESPSINVDKMRPYY